MAESTENTFVNNPSAVELSEEVRNYKSSGLPRIFASGDERLMKCINNGNNTVHPIHSQYEEMDGLNFLGNLTNIKQHIQFVKYINGQCNIPKNLLHLFLKGYEIDRYFNERNITEFDSPTKEAFANLKFYFNKCEAYIFQITSLHITEKDGFQICNDISGDDIHKYIQTKEDFEADIATLVNLIPAGRKIIFLNEIYPELVITTSDPIPELQTITNLLGTTTKNPELNTHSIRFFDYNKLTATPFFSQLFEENSIKFKAIGLGFAFIMLNEYFIEP